MDRRPEPEPPRDVLAAEAFAMGEGDRKLHREPAGDVLAAEAFAVPSAGQRRPPRDEHSDDAAPQDVLSAEEYAMPAGSQTSGPASDSGSGAKRLLARFVTGLVIALLVRSVVRMRRRRG